MKRSVAIGSSALESSMPRFDRLDIHTREVMNKSAVAFVLKLVGAGLAFMLYVAIGRYLGPADAGVYFLALTIVTLLAVVARAGMDVTLPRYVAAYSSENKSSSVHAVMRQGRRVVIGISIVVSCLAFGLAEWVATSWFNKPQLTHVLEMMALTVVPLALMTIHASALQGLKRTRDSMLIQSVIPPLVSLVMVLCLAPYFGLKGVVIAYGIGLLVALAMGYLVWRRLVPTEGMVDAGIPIKVLLASSLTLLGALMLQQITLALPMLMLGAWSSSAEAGLFATAQRTASLIGLVLIAVNSIVAPKIAELYQQGDMVNLERVARRSTLLMTLTAAPALLVFTFVPDVVMRLYGVEFQEGATMLTVMALGQMVNVTTGSVGFMLIMTGNELQFLSANLLALLIGIVTAGVLIPAYGGLGAAISVAMTLAVVNLLRVRYVRQKLGIALFPYALSRGSV